MSENEYLGPRGPRGHRGPHGKCGDRGKKGCHGKRGSKGPQGDSGPIGPVGPGGPTGPTGETGPTGPAGPSGITVEQLSSLQATKTHISINSGTINMSEGPIIIGSGSGVYTSLSRTYVGIISPTSGEVIKITGVTVLENSGNISDLDFIVLIDGSEVAANSVQLSNLIPILGIGGNTAIYKWEIPISCTLGFGSLVSICINFFETHIYTSNFVLTVEQIAK
jgi:hypothetical protein